MKKIILAALLWPLVALAQTYPSPTYENLTVLGTLHANFSLASLGAQAANTVVANATTSSASPIAFTMPICTGGTNALQWANGSGFVCNSSINAATLGGATFAAPGPIGSTTASTGAFTSLSASGTLSGAGFTNLVAPYAPIASPGFSGSPTAPTQALGDNTTKLATDQFVQLAGLHFSTQGVFGISSNTSIPASEAGSAFRFDANSLTATLPALSGTVSGQTFSFTAPGQYGSSVVPAGSDVIWPTDNAAAVLSLPVPSGQSVTLIAQPGTGWFIQGNGVAASDQSCVNVMQYGADRSGVNASDNAVTAALADPRNAGSTKCIEFGSGTFLLNNGIAIAYTASYESVTIKGQGADVTNIVVPSTKTGLYFNLLNNTDSFHVRDMSITTNGVNSNQGISTGTQASSISNPAESALNDISNVTIRGADGYVVTDYFSTGILIIGVSNINFINVEAFGSTAQSGTGLNINGSSSLPPVQFNINSSMFNSFSTGASFGSYTQGITVSQSNFTADRTCINVPSGATGTDQLTIIGNQFACGIGVYVQAQYQNLMIAHNLFILQNIAGVYGIYDSASVLYTIMGNTFQNANAPSLGNNPYGIYLNNDSGVGGMISGNVFRYMSPAVYLDTGTSGANVLGNAYFNNNTNVSDHGTNSVGVATP